MGNSVQQIRQMGVKERCGSGDPQRAQEAGRRAQLKASMGLRSTRTTARQREISDGGRSDVSDLESLPKTHLASRRRNGWRAALPTVYPDWAADSIVIGHPAAMRRFALQIGLGMSKSMWKPGGASCSILFVSLDEGLSIIAEDRKLPSEERGGGMLARTENEREESRRHILRLRWGCRWALALCALIDCWIGRFGINPDGVSYLDMGDRYWRGNWHDALSSYWSPLYGWIAGLMLRFTKPALRWEYPEVHLMNFAIFLAAVYCFEFFWRELQASRSEEVWSEKSEAYLWIFGYLLFACLIFKIGILSAVGPDLIVFALICLVSGMILRFAARRMSIFSAAWLGAALGIGYLAKAAMLPFGMVVLATIFAVAWRQRANLRLAAVASIFFLIVSTPFIALLSWNCHRFTFGDAGSLNTAWFVNGATPVYRHWQGDGLTSAHPRHTTRKLLNWPEVYEFATPVSGTYPVWYDPTYWWAGVDARALPGRLLAALVRNLGQIMDFWIKVCGILTTAVLMLFLLSDRLQDSWRQLMKFLPVLIPALALFLMYAMITWEARYTSGAMLAIYGAVIASSSISAEGPRSRALRAACLIFGAVALCWVLQSLAVSHSNSEKFAKRIATADQLRAMGIEPGDGVALIGDGFDAAGWARLDRVKIVAEVPRDLQTGDSAAAFWRSTPQDQQTVLNILKSTGAKAVVGEMPPESLPPGWALLGASGTSVFFLR
jgi:hypothetical protein